MKLTTYRFRLKDSSCRNRLTKMGWAVHSVWNYSNETNAYQWQLRRKTLTAFDLKTRFKRLGNSRPALAKNWACTAKRCKRSAKNLPSPVSSSSAPS